MVDLSSLWFGLSGTDFAGDAAGYLGPFVQTSEGWTALHSEPFVAGRHISEPV